MLSGITLDSIVPTSRLRSPDSRVTPASPHGTIRRVGVRQESTISSNFSCSTSLLRSAIMKYSLIATIVVLALAQGGFAQDASDLERLSEYFDAMKTKLIADVTEIIRSHDVTNQAQAFIEDKKTQMEPLVAQIQEQLRAAATSVESQLRPLTANVQAQFQPQIENFQKQMEAVFKNLADQTMALAN
uniref:Antifreeze protein type IV n=1 Tax=Gasterosteus aculeatus aculeatus TaxID=481459 RepID=A0AAQ4NP43_GASAC